MTCDAPRRRSPELCGISKSDSLAPEEPTLLQQAIKSTPSYWKGLDPS